MLRNKLEDILIDEGIGIREMARDLNMRYATVHNIVTKDVLDTITLESIVKIANYLGIGVEEMYSETIDPYEFEEVKVLNEAIELINKNSHTGSATDKAYESINELTDDIEEYGSVDNEKLRNAKKAIIDASKYAGYTNEQYSLQDDVRNILDEI